LLDAERVLLQVRIAEARVRTDLDVASARLEGAIAGPLEVTR
jgi:outer membrane protein TolC